MLKARPHSRRPRLRTAALLGAVLTVAAPAAATAATPSNPQVLQIAPGSGKQTVLAGGAPWNTLYGIAVGPTGTVYVANEAAPGPSTAGAGVYSIASPGYAITPIAVTAPTTFPEDLTVSGSTLYSLDSGRVLTIGTSAPFTQSVLSTGQVFSNDALTPTFGALTGSTLYTTAWGSCESVEGGSAEIVAVNTTTGVQTRTKGLGCYALGGIAVESAGTLVIAVTDTNTEGDGPTAPPKLLWLNPATGVTTTISSGGALRSPEGVALSSTGQILVADAQTGVVRVDPTTGAQKVLSQGGQMSGAYGIAVAPSGAIYVSEAGPGPVLTASVPSQQTFSSRGTKLTAACSRTCTIAYEINFKIGKGDSFGQSAAFHNVLKKSTLYLKLPEQVNQRIARALRSRQAVSATLTMTAQDPRTGAGASSAKASVRYLP